MSRPARPRGAQESDQVNPIRDSYVKACWGNLKMAALLNHFMFLVKCKAQNENREISKIETLEISREDLAKKVHIAPGSLVTFLHKFADAHYVSSKPYSPIFEVNTEAIEQAAINPPEKPARKAVQPREKKTSKIENSEFPIDIILDKFAKLEIYFSNLEIGIAKLETKLSNLEKRFAKLEIWKSPESTPEEASGGYFPTPSINSINSNESNKENIAPAVVSGGQESVSTNVPTQMFELLPWLSFDDALKPTKAFVEAIPEDHPHKGSEPGYRSWVLEQVQQMLAAKGCTVAIEYTANSYSQSSQSPTQETLFEDDAAYRKNTSNNPPSEEKPAKKAEMTSEQMEQCRRWYAHFEKVHGEPFEGKGEIVNVRKYIKMLVFKYDETTIMRIYKHLSEKDFKWSKPSFKFKITPYVVYDEAPGVLQQLGIIQEKAKPETKGLTDIDQERAKREEEKNQRNLDALTQGTIAKLQERISKNAKFQPFEIEMMVEQFGMTLPDHLMAQYNAMKHVAVS